MTIRYVCWTIFTCTGKERDLITFANKGIEPFVVFLKTFFLTCDIFVPNAPGFLDCVISGDNSFVLSLCNVFVFNAPGFLIVSP